VVLARLRRSAGRQPLLAVLAAAVLALAIAAVVVIPGLGRGASAGAPVAVWQPAPSPTASPEPTPPPEVEGGRPAPEDPRPEADAVTLSATGDIILGDAGQLPPEDGAGFFDRVAEALTADLVMGNLEQPLTGDTGFRKCGEDSAGCHAFRSPPHYAAHLREGGFDLLNLANNHGWDFGPDGHRNTRAALEAEGLAHTGARDQVTVVRARGVRVAVVGFSPYAWTNSVIDLEQAADVVARAAEQADLVVVQAHLGAEGADATRVRPGAETYFGEDRGDPIAFAHAVVDAGADLVIGHGPHVLRGLEFYRGRLIAYSLGNFAGGGGTLRAEGALGLGAVLRVGLYPDGTWASGTFTATHMRDRGLPRPDVDRAGLDLVRESTERDFPESGARLGRSGDIRPPGASG
jgi:hypothetical protein